MDPNALLEALKDRPFKKFTLNTVDGRQYEINHPEFVAVSPKGRQVFMFNEDESWSILEPLLISSLDFSATKPKNGPPTPPA
jgi:hypothetical protein